jgi:hypothetical protein
LKRAQRRLPPKSSADVSRYEHYHYPEEKALLAFWQKISLCAFTDILERRTGAGVNLIPKLIRITDVPEKVWYDYRRSWHPIFSTRPSGPVLPKGRIALLAIEVNITASYLWRILHREKTPSDAVAGRLAVATGAPPEVWLNNLESTHWIFVGAPLVRKGSNPKIAGRKS